MTILQLKHLGMRPSRILAQSLVYILFAVSCPIHTLSKEEPQPNDSWKGVLTKIISSFLDGLSWWSHSSPAPDQFDPVNALLAIEGVFAATVMVSSWHIPPVANQHVPPPSWGEKPE